MVLISNEDCVSMCALRVLATENSNLLCPIPRYAKYNFSNTAFKFMRRIEWTDHSLPFLSTIHQQKLLFFFSLSLYKKLGKYIFFCGWEENWSSLLTIPQYKSSSDNHALSASPCKMNCGNILFLALIFILGVTQITALDWWAYN